MTAPRFLDLFGGMPLCEFFDLLDVIWIISLLGPGSGDDREEGETGTLGIEVLSVLSASNVFT